MDTSWTSLHTQKDAGELIKHHKHVVTYWSDYMETRENCHNFVRGRQHSDADLRLYKKKRKSPVVFNKMLAPMRTVLGQFVSNRYDVKPSPVEPTDQATADIPAQMYHWTADSTGVKHKDVEVFKECYVGGSAWQESYIEVIDGEKPRICVQNQNNFAIYPDPDSRDLINREDCEFIDRESFLTEADLIDRFPEKADLIRRSLQSGEKEKNSYEKTNLVADRSHEERTEKNGRYKVIERFYKVRKKYHFGINGAQRVDIGEDEPESPIADRLIGFQQDYPDYKLRSRPMEYLWLAVACESISQSEFLLNEPYHCQPRDARTGRIMFPLIEVVAESLGGEYWSFVEPEIGPQQIINAMMANKLHAAKHTAGPSRMLDPSQFGSDKDIQDITQNHSDGDRMFKLKSGGDIAKAVGILPQGQVGPDNDELLEFADAFHEEVSSAPKALRGLAENAGTPAAQTEMRIQQAFTQLMGLISNWKHFLTKRAKLWQFYWAEYYDYEEQFRVIEKKNPEDPDFFTVNQAIGLDPMGNIVRANDLKEVAKYDMTFEDSFQSPTMKDKAKQGLTQILQMAAQLDPVMASWLIKRFLELTDLPEEDKIFLKQHMAVVQQQQQQQAMAQAQQQQMQMQSDMLAQDKQIQDMAQAEAEQTAMPPSLPNREPPTAVTGPVNTQALQPV